LGGEKFAGSRFAFRHDQCSLSARRRTARVVRSKCVAIARAVFPSAIRMCNCLSSSIDHSSFDRDGSSNISLRTLHTSLVAVTRRFPSHFQCAAAFDKCLAATRPALSADLKNIVQQSLHNAFTRKNGAYRRYKIGLAPLCVASCFRIPGNSGPIAYGQHLLGLLRFFTGWPTASSLRDLALGDRFSQAWKPDRDTPIALHSHATGQMFRCFAMKTNFMSLPWWPGKA
jgi:hypothetical protein